MGIHNSVNFENVTKTFVPIEDYMYSLNKYFDVNKKTQYGNINKVNIISGSEIGNGNCVIPLYINGYHWESVKKYLPFTLGIMMTHNPLGYMNNHINSVYSFLIYFTRLVICNNNYQNETYIRIYLTYLRTCIQISMDNGYIRGVYKLIDKYIDNPKNRIHKYIYQYQSLLGQILCVRTQDFEKLDILLEYIIEETIRYVLKNNNYSEKILKQIFNGELEIDKIKYELDNIVTDVFDNIYIYIDDIISFRIMVNIIESLYQHAGSYNKFLEEIEENFGYLSNEYIQIFKSELDKYVAENIYTITEYMQIFKKINNDTITNRIYLYIIQGLLTINNSKRLKFINDNKYLNVQKMEINIDNELMKLSDIYINNI